MSGRSVVSLLAAFASFTRVHHTVMAEPIPDRVDLANGVLKEQIWPDMWFGSIADGEDWMPVSAILGATGLETAEKLQMIPVMMGCDYGLRFNRFFSAAALAIDRCNYSAQNDQQTLGGPTGRYVQSDLTGECWKQTDVGLRRGLSAVAQVESALTLIAGGNTELDAFHTALDWIGRTLPGSEARADFPGMSDSMNGAAGVLHEFLIYHCRPVYLAPFNPTEVLHVCESENYLHVNGLYVKQMEDNSKYISDRLTEMGFRYNAADKTTTFGA